MLNVDSLSVEGEFITFLGISWVSLCLSAYSKSFSVLSISPSSVKEVAALLKGEFIFMRVFLDEDFNLLIFENACEYFTISSGKNGNSFIVIFVSL